MRRHPGVARPAGRLVGWLALGLASTADAAVPEIGPGGFVIVQEAVLAASPGEVYRRFVEDYGRWWSPAHSWSGDAANFVLEPRAGGCLCERWNGGEALHMLVGYVEPGKTLRLVGGLGPLQQLGLSGTLNVAFRAIENGTRVELEYRVGGFRPEGFAQLAPAVDRVLAEQLGRLKQYVETGAPVPEGAR